MPYCKKKFHGMRLNPTVGPSEEKSSPVEEEFVHRFLPIDSPEQMDEVMGKLPSIEFADDILVLYLYIYFLYLFNVDSFSICLYRPLDS